MCEKIYAFSISYRQLYAEGNNAGPIEYLNQRLNIALSCFSLNKTLYPLVRAMHRVFLHGWCCKNATGMRSAIVYQ